MKKKKVVFVVSNIVIIALIAFAIFAFYGLFTIEKQAYQMCKDDRECVKVQTTCCPCESGGQEKCVSKSEVAAIKRTLDDCGNVFCAQVYNCKVESCECTDGNCTQVLKK